MTLVPERRELFGEMSVADNLELGAYLRFRRGNKPEIAQDLEHAYSLFPRLQERLSQKAGTLSGGEQQMLAIARALLTNPRVLILDEATEGLAPLVRDEIWRTIRLVREAGIATLVVDKSVAEVTAIADRVAILVKGRIVFDGKPADLTAAPSIAERHLGV